MSCGTQDTASVSVSFRLQAYHPLWMSFPEHSAILQCSYLRGPTTPTLTQNQKTIGHIRPIGSMPFAFVLGSVWAFPLSLAATEGISIDFSSSGY